MEVLGDLQEVATLLLWTPITIKKASAKKYTIHTIHPIIPAVTNAIEGQNAFPATAFRSID